MQDIEAIEFVFILFDTYQAADERFVEYRIFPKAGSCFPCF